MHKRKINRTGDVGRAGREQPGADKPETQAGDWPSGLQLVPEQKQIKYAPSQGLAPGRPLQPPVPSAGEGRRAKDPPMASLQQLIRALHKVSHFGFPGT